MSVSRAEIESPSKRTVYRMNTHLDLLWLFFVFIVVSMWYLPVSFGIAPAARGQLHVTDGSWGIWVKTIATKPQAQNARTVCIIL